MRVPVSAKQRASRPGAVPYASRVGQRYAGWLAQQRQAGAVFTDAQRWWLDRIADGAVRDLGTSAARYLEQLNAELTA